MPRTFLTYRTFNTMPGPLGVSRARRFEAAADDPPRPLHHSLKIVSTTSLLSYTWCARDRNSAEDLLEVEQVLLV